jgi:Tfp pilus assembly protein PilF
MVQIRNMMREKGLKNLEAAYKGDPDNVELKVKLAEFYIRGTDKEIEIAEKMLKEAIEVDPRIGDAHAALGKIYEKREMNDEAIDSYKKAL